MPKRNIRRAFLLLLMILLTSCGQTEEIPVITLPFKIWLRPFTGKLSYTWPSSVDQLPLDFANLNEADVLFPFDYGLETGS